MPTQSKKQTIHERRRLILQRVLTTKEVETVQRNQLLWSSSVAFVMFGLAFINVYVQNHIARSHDASDPIAFEPTQDDRNDRQLAYNANAYLQRPDTLPISHLRQNQKKVGLQEPNHVSYPLVNSNRKRALASGN